jgi:tRNA dimethylallyltransferase
LPATAYALLGPTASGKSRLALDLARKFPLEIVSMDSALVYRGMDIGTAKPTAAERALVPHHLIDLVNPDEPYSAGRWRDDCIAVVLRILSNKKMPLLVGGTMLYYRALSAGLDELPGADAAIRKAIDDEARRRGWPALHAELAKVDPAAAKRIQPGDSHRIQRALEVFRVSGKPLSALQGRPSTALPFALQAFSILADKKLLDQKIEKRFDGMLAAGLVEEVKALKAKFQLTPDMPSMRAVGYRQVWEHLEGGSTAAQMRERAVAATRQLAKRQLTWLRSFTGIRPADDLESALVQGSNQCK